MSLWQGAIVPPGKTLEEKLQVRAKSEKPWRMDPVALLHEFCKEFVKPRLEGFCKGVRFAEAETWGASAQRLFRECTLHPGRNTP